MVLHRERRRVEQPDPLGGHVVQVDVCELYSAEPVASNDRCNARLHPSTEVVHVEFETVGLLGQKFADASEIHAEPVVLAGDLHAASEKVLDRLVPAAVPVLQLVRPPAHGEREHLMAQADAEDRHLAEELAHGTEQVRDGGRIAWPVRQEQAVRRERADLGGRRRGRHDGDVAAGLGQQAEDVVLHT